MSDSIFGSHKVINEKIGDSNLRTYFVDFELQDNGNYEYRWKALINLLQSALIEFAYGLHEGDKTSNSVIIDKLVDASRSIYKIKEYNEVRILYEKGKDIDDLDLTKKYLKRGEFGELILHLLLRDFHKTIPLLSKIYFKDSYGHTIHGFDGVHIQPNNKSLWLGESKLYVDGKSGIKELVKDIKEHFKREYLQDEFNIISKKIKPYDDIPEKKYWIDLMDQKTKLQNILNSITIPLICTYTSKNFDSYSIELEDNIKKEIEELKNYFDLNNNHPLKTQLNIILLLFPVKCKNELVKRMHKKLFALQSLND
ncbi:MAG: DUF1837 domain-containing protein [Methanosarcinales archaeon]|jgi:hypothetical protein|nr:DUF1837 domain-containing protein [Methanosarcinales archaeon]